MTDILPDIISDILSRLPVKPLLRFRCVSKPWCALIDSKDFIKLHLRRSIRTKSNRTILIDDTYKGLFAVDLDFFERSYLYSFECSDFDFFEREDLAFERSDFGKSPFDYHIISNSCNGLVLAVSDEPMLWNPSTRKYKKLPPTPLECSGKFQVCDNENYGFGYDSKTDDYKVVRVTEVCDARDGEYLYSEAKVYSLKSNSWKRVQDFEHMLPSEKRVWGVCVNDALHTVVKHCKHVECIMAFDLGTNEHYEVPKPDLRGVSTGVASVDVMDGCLTALVGRKMNTSEIWLMKEYGVKESWVKLLSFMPQIPEPYGYLTPLCYSNTKRGGGGEEVLLNYDGRCLLAYNLRREHSRIVDLPGIVPQFHGIHYMGSSFHAEVCVGSLVSLDSPEEAKEKQIVKGRKKGIDKQNKKRDDFLSVGFKLKL